MIMLMINLEKWQVIHLRPTWLYLRQWIKKRGHLHFPPYTNCTPASKCFSHAGNKYGGGKTAGGHFRGNNGVSRCNTAPSRPRAGSGKYWMLGLALQLVRWWAGDLGCVTVFLIWPLKPTLTAKIQSKLLILACRLSLCDMYLPLCTGLWGGIGQGRTAGWAMIPARPDSPAKGTAEGGHHSTSIYGSCWLSAEHSTWHIRALNI